jgi:riboflavin kinase / FMN adenylyltransferase
MRVIHNIKEAGSIGPSVAAIGVFDGVHRAHSAIIKAAVSKAGRLGVPAVVVTFWPHPRGQESLYSLEHRLRLLEELGVDLCIVVRFTRMFARMSPEVFVRDIICRCLNARVVYVGENFRFGKNASGNVAALSRLLMQCGAAIKVFKTLKAGGNAISSSYIRRLISLGKLAAAQRLLLRPVAVYGHVVHGTGRGALLGFPTANIDPHHEITPPSGIYAVRVLLNNARLKGICYIGTRPTFYRTDRFFAIEVHIFNFNKNIYDTYIEVQFIKKIRSDRSFASASELTLQIKRDISKAKEILA